MPTRPHPARPPHPHTATGIADDRTGTARMDEHHPTHPQPLYNMTFTISFRPLLRGDVRTMYGFNFLHYQNSVVFFNSIASVHYVKA